MTHPFEVLTAAKQAIEPLYNRAIVLGYTVSVNLGGEIGPTPDKTFWQVWYWVRRFDLPSGNEQTFATTTKVTEYLDYLETSPVYCLELVNNPRITIETKIEPEPDGHASTWITDTQTGEVFGVRSVDLEAITRLCVHAESQPTIGNWEPSN